MSEPILKFENVGKLYHLGTFGTGSLTRDLNRWWKINIKKEPDPYIRIGESNNRSKKGNSDVVWALKNITFDVNQGDVIGIIGKNGAGKSTLLKLLSRITTPSTGIIKAKGRVASLLEVGTGFHTELTGRENIYMNGTVMGMTRPEIDRKLDEIVDFAGVERYLDTPVKRYSSGMMVRLGFAVAAFLEPEILVVDEVLAVGDAEFQRKAIGKMQDISSGDGRTVLFVSHNMASVRSLCSKGILLDKGKLTFTSSTEETINKYLIISEIESERKIIERITYKKDWLDIHRIEFNGTEYNRSTIKSGQESLTLIIEGFAHDDFKTDPMLIIKNRDGIPLASLAEGHTKGKIVNIPKGPFKIERIIKLPKFISQGELIADIFLHHPMVEYQLRISEASTLKSQGYFESGGRAGTLYEQGLFQLQTISQYN
ncbi:MAG: ABC transporter ATP-binding protein [Erysipelotrichales bacterium]|nr:ABC transporter ATP-binding protein [Erysipelotrichales bacterium]